MPSKKKKYNARFPPARIKKIMQTDEDVGKVAYVVPVIISRALELFIESLILKSADTTRSKNARTLSVQHIKQTISSDKKFDFLKDLVANIPDVQPSEQEDEPGEHRGRGRPKKKKNDDDIRQHPARKRNRKDSRKESTETDSATEAEEGDSDTDDGDMKDSPAAMTYPAGVGQSSYLPEQPSTSTSFSPSPLMIKEDVDDIKDIKPVELPPFTVYSQNNCEIDNNIAKSEIKTELPTMDQQQPLQSEQLHHAHHQLQLQQAQQQNCLSTAQQNTASASKNNFFRPFQTSPPSSASATTQNIPAQITSSLSPRPNLDDAASSTNYPPSDQTQSSVLAQPPSFYTANAASAVYERWPQGSGDEQRVLPHGLPVPVKNEQPSSVNEESAAAYGNVYRTEQQPPPPTTARHVPETQQQHQYISQPAADVGGAGFMPSCYYGLNSPLMQMAALASGQMAQPQHKNNKD